MPLITPLISSQALPITSSGGVLPVIGYDNLLEQGTVIATSEIPTFEAANAYDWRTATFWKMADAPTEQFLTLTLGSAKPASYFAYFKHDLDEKGNGIHLQYSLDGGASWLDATTEEIPANDRPRIVTFNKVTSGLWRVRITLNGTPTGSILGAVAFGQVMNFERGMQVGFGAPGFINSNSYVNNFSEAGEFLGKSLIRRGEERTIQVVNTTRQWIRDVWQPFSTHVESKPFFFGWNLVNRPQDVTFCVPLDDPRATFNTLIYQQASIRCRGLVGNSTNTTPPQQV